MSSEYTGEDKYFPYFADKLKSWRIIAQQINLNRAFPPWASFESHRSRWKSRETINFAKSDHTKLGFHDSTAEPSRIFAKKGSTGKYPPKKYPKTKNIPI